MVTVLVTRLMPFAGSLIDSLEQHGYEVIHESLLSIEPLYCRRPEIPIAGKPVVAITSRVTLDILKQRPDEIDDLLSVPCYCVGDKTADDARKLGFTNVISAQGNGKALASLIMDNERSKCPVLHIGGEDVSPDPQMLLNESGWQVVHWPLYKAIEIQDLSEHLINDIKRSELNVVLLYSVRAAQIFVKLIKRYELETCCSNLTAIGLSQPIIDELQSLNFNMTIASTHPTELDLIDAVIINTPTAGELNDKKRRHNS